MYVKSRARTQSESYTVSDMESCGLADWRHSLSFVPRLIIARWFYKQCLLPGPVEPKTVAGKRKSGLSEWRARKKNSSLSFYQTTNVSGSAASISCVSTIWFIYLTLTQWWKPGKFFFQETDETETETERRSEGWAQKNNRTRFWLVRSRPRLSSTALVGHHCPATSRRSSDKTWGKADQLSSDWWNELSVQPGVQWVDSPVMAWFPSAVCRHTHTHTVNSTVSVVDVSVKCCGVCCE